MLREKVLREKSDNALSASGSQDHVAAAGEEGPAGRDVESAFLRATDGQGLGREDALLLLERAPTEELLRAASSVRERFHGRVISYSKKVFIPLTTLCRDYCGYCTFRNDPGEPGAHFMAPEEVLAAAKQARRAGCKEALFSLGDQPEKIFPEARDFLHHRGFERTLDYLAAMTELTMERTGLLPHANPGVMSAESMRRLRASNVSLGLMLENVSPRLMRAGAAHAEAPDKVPSLRLRTMEEAGRLRIPFTTGILIGIGETLVERVDSLIAIRDVHRRFGHIQEVIIQTFRAKPGIPMPAHPEATLERALSGASAPVRAMLESVLGGAELGCGEGIALTAVEGADLLALVKTADELRRRAIGDTITYVVNRNLNFTNVCIVGCAFCGFSRKPGDADAYFHSHESLVARAREAQDRGATEVCIQGGLPRELDGYYYRDLIRSIIAVMQA